MEEINIPKIETKKSKKKIWFFLGIIGLIAVIYFGYPYLNNSSLDNLTPVTNMTFEQLVCSSIRTTPTWINAFGIIDEGYSNFESSNPKEAIDLLINANVTFVYNSDNSVCKNQIAYFGSEWGRYVNSGYTMNCKNVL